MKEGTIAKIMDKGFGFISEAGQEKDLFFHANEVVEGEFNDLQEGDKVTFEIADGPKGPNAVQVKIVQE
jgi:CspA family cold shock protein